MKNLDFAIGKKLPLDILMQPVYLGGGRGSGKTSGAKTLFEAAYDAGAQCITIAPTGKWFSLRLAADGKSPGLTGVVVFGGPHGDVPLLPTSGKLIAKLIVEKRVHAVLDVSLMRKGERARFLADFLEEFWLLKKVENESFPVVMFIEEAHAVVPQKPQPEEARMLGAAEDLVREGRNHGIGVVLLDQRSAVVNKNVLALVEVLLAMRTIHHLDRKTFEAWVVEKDGQASEWVATLPALEAGEAYLYAPVLGIFERIKMRMPRTFNATATARIGEKTVKMGTLAPIDVEALKTSMAAVVAEAERDDPKALRKEIAALKAELAKKPVPPAPKPVAPKEVPVLQGKERKAVETLTGRLERVIDEATTLHHDLGEMLKKYPAAPSTAQLITRRTPLPQPKWTVAPNGAPRKGYTDLRPPPSLDLRAPPSGIGKGERIILTAIAQHGDAGVSREQLSVLTAYKKSSRDTYLQKLAAAGFIYLAELITASAEGIAALGSDFEPLPVGDALREHWLQRLPEGERKIFEVVTQAYPNPIAREAIDEVTGYKKSSRDTYLQKLAARKLIIAGRGEVTASHMLFGVA